MIFKVLSILPLYIGIFVICFRFKHVIKAISEIEELLNILLPDTDEGGKEENRRDFLINAVNQGKGDLLPGKIPWTFARIKKVCDKGIDKLKSHFVQAETKLKAERTGKTVSKHVVNLYSTGVSKLSLIHISEPTRLLSISYAVFCLKKKTVGSLKSEFYKNDL